MTETTEQFIERFKATGLDMLCEARRRAEQALPWHAKVVTGRASFRHPAFGWEYGGLPSLTYGRSVYKASALGVSMPHTFLDIDLTDLERRVMESYARPNWDLFVHGRRAGHALSKLSAAFAMAAAAMPHRFTDWDFQEPVAEPYEPKQRQLWPGVKTQVDGERRLNPRRIAKDRMKKKLAKKSKRK